MHKFLEYFNQYVTQSKYDYRGNSLAFDMKRTLISDPNLKSYDDIDKAEPNFYTIYAGSDPIEKSRKIIKKIVKIPVNLGKYGEAKHFYCLEETCITRMYMNKYPTVQVQLRKLPSDFDITLAGSKDKITDLSNSLGYSLFNRNTPAGQSGATA